MSTLPLSEHTIRVPPRQTSRCKLTLTHPTPASKIKVHDVYWDDEKSAPGVPLAALYLMVNKVPLAHERHFIEFEASKILDIEVGNCSDAPITVEFEILGRP